MSAADTASGAGTPPRLSPLRLQVTSLLAALQFLTLVPPIIRRSFEPEELGGAVAYFPLVGLLLGLILAGLDWVLGLVLPFGVRDVVLLIAWVVLTGALHLDGFMDSCDGLLGGRTPERRLEIMRDHRIGAFALAGGVLLIMLKYAALDALPARGATLLVAPVLGRWAMSLAMVVFPYARAEGVGRMLKDNVQGRHLAVATAVSLVAVLAAMGWRGPVALAVAGGWTWAVSRYTLWRIPGLTGDVYGALCELTEALTLVVLVLLGGGA